MTVEAVTFDFWNTLVYEERGHLRGRRLDAWAGILEEEGFAVERQQLEAAFDLTWQAYVSSWQKNRQFQAVEAAVQTVEALGISVPQPVHAALVEAFTSAGMHAELHLAPHVDEVVRDLHGRGVPLGIVCDVGFTGSHQLKAHLEGRGLLPMFAGQAFSDEVGVYKPDAQIFRHAFEAMGVSEPTRVAHVGDLRRTDIAGGRALGMTTVRYCGIFDDAPETEGDSLLSPSHEPEAHHVIDDHRRLPEVLGLG